MTNGRNGGDAPVVVIGAGLAGLTAAALLHEAGLRVLVLEAGDGPGGRVRTDRHPEGFLLDRGFQVMLDAYPALRRQVELDALDLRRFDAGAHVWTGKRLVPLADPLRHPGAAVRDLTTTLFPPADKLRLAAFAAKTRGAAWASAREAALAEPVDVSAAEALWRAGFGRAFVDRFARPFWGGIALDRSLAVSSGLLSFTLKMFLLGGAALPAAGVQAVPATIARRLPGDAIRYGARVERIVRDGSRATGVVVGEETIPARAVIVAADPVAARALTGVTAIPDTGLGCVTVYLRGTRDPGTGARLVLDGTGRRTVNHLAPLSAVQPSYAPAGEHLLAAVMLGKDLNALPDEPLMASAQRDTGALLGQPAGDWTPLAVVRVPFSQYAQPPGIHRQLPDVRAGGPGLYLAGEATVDSSVNGAIISGEHAARALLDDLRAGAAG